MQIGRCQCEEEKNAFHLESKILYLREKINIVRVYDVGPHGRNTNTTVYRAIPSSTFKNGAHSLFVNRSELEYSI